MVELSEREILEGKNSKFWKAIEEKLWEFLEDIHIEMEDVDNDLGIYKRLAGSTLAIRRILAIPDVLLNDAELAQEDKTLTKEDENE